MDRNKLKDVVEESLKENIKDSEQLILHIDLINNLIDRLGNAELYQCAANELIKVHMEGIKTAKEIIGVIK